MAKKSHKNKDVLQAGSLDERPAQPEVEPEALTCAQDPDAQASLDHAEIDSEKMEVYPAAEKPLVPDSVSNELAAYLMQQAQSAATARERQAHDLTSTAQHLMIAAPLLGMLSALIAVPSLLILGTTWQAICMISLFALALIPASAAFLVASALAGQRLCAPMVFLEELFSDQDAKNSTPHNKLELAQRIYDAEKSRLHAVDAQLERRERALTAVRILLIISSAALAVSLVFLLVLLIIQVA